MKDGTHRVQGIAKKSAIGNDMNKVWSACNKLQQVQPGKKRKAFKGDGAPTGLKLLRVGPPPPPEDNPDGMEGMLETLWGGSVFFNSENNGEDTGIPGGLLALVFKRCGNACEMNLINIMLR
jgi:hypothetical protein